MINKTNKPIFWILFILGVALYFSVKFLSYKIPEHLYNQKSFPLLNKICDTDSVKPLDFYLGKFEENVSGPISSAISGILLMIFVLIFFQKPSAKTFGLTALIFLVITKFEVLFFPPWGDHAGGSLAEAVWLARNNFDYIGLFNQPSSIEGGPKFFLFSLYPGFIAFLIKFTPSPTWFLIYAHFVNFALSAFIIAIFYSILLKIFDKKNSILTSILLLSLPLYQSMTEMINMEISCLFFAFLAAKYLIDKRIPMASLMAIISVLIKGSGAYACGMVFAACIILFFFDEKYKFKFSLIFWAVFCFFVAALQVYLRSKFVHIADKGHNTVSLFCGLNKIISLPYIFKFYLLSIATLIFIFIKDVFVLKRDSFINSIKGNYVSIIMLLGSTMWYAQQANVSVMGPRYKLILAPFLLYGIVLALKILCNNKKIITVVLFISVIISYFASYGLFYPARIESQYYDYGKLERSLEYRNDLKLHQKLAKEFETTFKGFTIGAPWITAHYLAFNEFGYVKKPLDVILYGQTVYYGGIKAYKGLRNLNIKKTIWIGFKSDYPSNVVYPIDPKDIVIKEVYYGDKKVTLFMGGFAIDRIYTNMMLDELYRRGIIKLK